MKNVENWLILFAYLSTFTTSKWNYYLEKCSHHQWAYIDMDDQFSSNLYLIFNKWLFIQIKSQECCLIMRFKTFLACSILYIINNFKTHEFHFHFSISIEFNHSFVCSFVHSLISFFSLILMQRLHYFFANSLFLSFIEKEHDKI